MKLRSGPGMSLWLLLSALLPAGCQSQLSVDLAVADREGIASVDVDIRGVELIDTRGRLHRLDMDQPAAGHHTVNLRDYTQGRSLPLLHNAALPAGDYDGVRLLFDENGAPPRVRLGDGRELPLRVDNVRSRYADLDFKATRGKPGRLLATLDLRFSLHPEHEGLAYRLDPQLRAVDAQRAQRVTGVLPPTEVESVACRKNRGSGTGVAAYLYSADSRRQRDFVADRIGPIASTPALRRNGGWIFAFDGLSPGVYTVAWTCEADAEQPQRSDAIRFSPLGRFQSRKTGAPAV